MIRSIPRPIRPGPYRRPVSLVAALGIAALMAACSSTTATSSSKGTSGLPAPSGSGGSSSKIVTAADVDQAQLSATISGFGLCVLPKYVAHTATDLVPVLPDEISLTRSYWMVADADIAETGLIRLAQRYLRGLLTEAGDFFS